MLRRASLALLNAVPAPVARRMRRESRLARFARPFVNWSVGEGYSQVSVRAGEGCGLKLLIDPRREKYYWTGSHEPEVQAALDRLVKQDDTIWDVGGHVGFFALIAARRSRPGLVHVFEPVAENRSRLDENIRANALENLRVHPYALASRDGQATLRDRDSSLMWSLVDGSSETGIAVECRTLDSVLDSAGVPDLIKIDVEEAELDVLRGGLGLFQRHAPTLIVEFTNEAMVAEARQLLPYYRFEQIAPRHWLLRKHHGGSPS
jgi:FkbM family methyltransferase